MSRLDTIDANTALGFERDERRYDIAAGMLQMLGVARIALLTNNPLKLAGLRRAGIVYVLLNGPGSRHQLRRFACDVMPAFAGPTKIRAAG